MASQELEAFENPEHPGNQPKYRTGKACVNSWCERPAGTAWSRLWCFECNVERITRINKELKEFQP